MTYEADLVKVLSEVKEMRKVAMDRMVAAKEILGTVGKAVMDLERAVKDLDELLGPDPVSKDEARWAAPLAGKARWATDKIETLAPLLHDVTARLAGTNLPGK